VNRKKEAGPFKVRVMRAPRFHFDRGEATWPVVTVNHIGLIANASQERDRRAAEKRKSFMVVGLAINSRTRKIVWSFDQIGRRAEGIADANRNAWFAPAPGDFQIFDICPGDQTPINLIVKRSDQQRINVLSV